MKISKIIAGIKSLFSKIQAIQSVSSIQAPDAAGQPKAAGPAGMQENDGSCCKKPNLKAACEQIGLFNYTTDEECIGFYLDPGNRWLKLADEIFQPGMDELYEERIRELSRTSASERMASRLSHIRIPPQAESYGKQLALPCIDAELKSHLNPATKDEGDDGQGRGREAYPFRVAFGSLVVKNILGLSDRGTSKIIQESPYIQKFLGFEKWSADNTVHPSSLVHFRERLDLETMKKINEIAITEAKNRSCFMEAANAHGQEAGGTDEASPAMANEDCSAAPDPAASGVQDVQGQPANGKSSSENCGTLILDATCGPAYIRYPQDFSVLNEGRRDIEDILAAICKENGFKKPRTNPVVLQKEAQNLSKDKRKTSEKIRRVIRLELNAIERNLTFIDKMLKKGAKLLSRDIMVIQVVRAVCAQQKYMYENRVNSVPDRIVSISQPFIRPINRGKVNCPTEFGPKFDLGVDGNGYARITFFSYDNYNESTHLQEAVEAYKKREGHYPESVKADQIYRNRANIEFCRKRGIRLSGPPLGRKPADVEKQKAQVELEKQDMVERIAVERHFSREKRCFGLDPIMMRTPETVAHAVSMAVFLDNMVPVGF